MTYIAVGYANDGDVEAMLQFCHMISEKSEPYHGTFLRRKLLERIQFWPVYLDWSEMLRMVKGTYKKALRKHYKESSVPNILPNRIYYVASKVLRYRPKGGKSIITIDMNYGPVILVQSYSKDLALKYADRANIGPVIEVSGDKVLLPSEALNLQLSLGTVLHLLK